MNRLNAQLRRLLALEALTSFRPAGSLWVLLLVGRGFSLLEIGLAEGFFHMVSLLCEVPSGMCSDLLGRRRVMVASQLVMALSAMCWLVSETMAGVCLAMGASALSYNLASGTREAITYDSLLQYGREGEYLKMAARQGSLYRLGEAAALLCAGATLLVGWRVGYCVDMVLSLSAAAVTLSLWEPIPGRPERRPSLVELPRSLWTCAKAAAAFLRACPRAGALMLLSALPAAAATLLRFFLQDALPATGTPPALLGPVLLALSLSASLGAWGAEGLGRLPYRRAAPLCALGVGVGLGCALGAWWPLLALGGLLSAFCDESLNVLTDSRLNHLIPSDRRATLVSVSSMVFSLVMIILSPLAGAVAGLRG